MKRRKFQVILVILSICFPSILFAQTADEIIDKHIEAHGGKEKWEAVKTMKLTGKFTAFSLEKDYTAFKTNKACYYADFHLGEQHVIESYDGKKGWTIDPWQEILYARNINKNETDVFEQKAEFFTPFYKYKEKGHKVEFVGKSDIDGTEVFTLKLTKANGTSETWYLDAKTYLEYKCETPWVDFAQSIPAEVFFDDFRTVDGLVIPFFTERLFWQRDRMIQIEEIEINPEFDKNLLVMPQREEMSKLDFLKGDWVVKMEFMGRKGKYQEAGLTESNINYASTNLLHEKMSCENGFPTSLSINYSYNGDTKMYRIAAFNDLTSSIDIFQGDFINDALVFEDTKINFTDEKNPTRNCKQFIYTIVDDNSFTVENKVSQDEGKTWNPQARFTYTRKTDNTISQK
ncbi:hypothetical protein [Labilibaculum sp.]|uniref:hypothetical protein n=1 Tax=Labilibaculum sp. TaxID=2060723 RepID=UPI002AA69D05|nr:hypothetical protein [Labilibaculum sp.]